MPAKTLIIEEAAKKRFLKLPIKVHKRLIKALENIQKNPVAGIKLKGELEQYYKYRIGDYRIVYKFDPKESKVIIVKVEHRQGVYK